MKFGIDLHTHSTASDGTLSPSELISLAKKSRLSAIALTDHDSVSGIAEASEAAVNAGVEFVPGIELSTDYQGKELHVIGLYIDAGNKMLLEALDNFVRSRDDRNRKMITLLQKEGFDITEKKIKSFFGDCVMTRAHFARYLVHHGFVKDMKEVFSVYLGDGCRCYVDREKMHTCDAVRLIKNAGGIAILAHPVLYHYPEHSLRKLLREWKTAGLDGIEAIYSSNSLEEEKFFRKIAKEEHLALSGGSDFHGSNKPQISLGCGYGNMEIPYELLTELKKLI
ncbi:MAG: PHP domain-containing protein [Eubacterium sp.]|nr:PHP domain-containing protein [Eubacterium sp.]